MWVLLQGSRVKSSWSRLDVDRNGAPPPLAETDHRQAAPGGVPGQNGEPDVHRVESPRLLDDEADAEGDDDLGNDGDVEWALGVAGALQSAGVCQRDCDQDAGQTQHPEESGPDLDDCGLIHAEDGKKLAGKEQKEEADEPRTYDSIAGGDVHRLLGSVAVARPEILAGHGC